MFLACPHFWEEESVFETVQTWRERSEMRGQLKPKRIDRKLRYRAKPKVFGHIINLYSEKDAVQ